MTDPVALGKALNGNYSPNDYANFGINAGGYFAPPGVGFGLGLAKGAYDSYAYPGMTSNTNNMNLLQQALYGPSLGERAYGWLTDAGNTIGSWFGCPTGQNSPVGGYNAAGSRPSTQVQMGVAQPGMPNAAALGMAGGGAAPQMMNSGVSLGMGNMGPSSFGGYAMPGLGSMPFSVEGGTTGYLSGGGGDMAQGKQSIGGLKAV